MNSKWRNGGLLVAIITMTLYLLTTLLGLQIDPWIGDVLVAAVTVLWVLGIVSNPNGDGIFNFTGVPWKTRLEDPTVIKALIAWAVMLATNLNNIFKWYPVTVDINAILLTILGIFQVGGFVKGFPEGIPAPDAAAAIPITGGITDGADGVPTQGGN